MKLKHFFRTSVSFLTLTAFMATNLVPSIAMATQGEECRDKPIKLANYRAIDGRQFRSLNDLRHIEGLDGLKVYLTLDTLTELENVDLSHIAKLYIEAKNLTFAKDVVLKNFRYRIENGITFGQSNNALVNFKISNGNLKGVSGTFDARFAKLSGHRARVTTTKEDILIGEGRQEEGTATSKSTDGYNLGYIKHVDSSVYWSGLYDKENGAFFNFKENVTMHSAKDIFLKGALMYVGHNLRMFSPNLIELSYANVNVFGSAFVKSANFNIYRTSPVRLLKSVRTVKNKTITKKITSNSHIQLWVTASNPSVLNIGGDLELDVPVYKAYGSQILVGGKIKRAEVEGSTPTTILKPYALWTNFNYNGYLSYIPTTMISHKLHLPLGQNFDVDADIRADAIEIKGGTGTIKNLSLQQPKRKDMGPFDLDLTQHVTQKPIGALIAGKTAEGYFFSDLGEFHDLDFDYKKTLVVDKKGQIIPEDKLPENLKNPLKNLPLSLALQEMVAGKLQRLDSPLWHSAGGMFAFLAGHGEILKNDMKQGNILNPFAETQEYPFMYFKMVDDGTLSTHVHFPKGYASTYLTGSIEARSLDIETTGNANLLDRIFKAHQAYFFAGGILNFDVTKIKKYLGHRGSYEHVTSTNCGIESDGTAYATGLGGVEFHGAYHDVNDFFVWGAHDYYLAENLPYYTRTKHHRTYGNTFLKTTVKVGGTHVIVLLPQYSEDGKASVILQSPHFETKHGITINLNGGDLKILSVIEQFTRHKTINKKNFFVQKTGGSTRTKKTVVDGTYDMGDGELKILNPGEIYVQHRFGELSKVIEDAVKGHENIFFEPLRDEETYKKLKTRYAITPEFATLVGVAITIASMGMDGGLGGTALASALAAEGLTATAITAAVNAGAAQLISRGVGHMIEHQGNPFKTVQSLLEPENLKNLAKTMAIAAATAVGGQVLGDKINMPDMKFDDPKIAELAARIQSSLKTAAVSMVKNVIGGEKFNQSILNAVADCVQSVLATEIKGLLSPTELQHLSSQLPQHYQKFARYAMHGLAGAISGAITQKDISARAFGAVVGEICADIFKSQMKAQGKYNPHSETFKADIEKYTTYSSSIAKGLSVFFHLNAEEAALSASIAARENCFYVIPFAILALCITDAYFDEIHNGTQAALKSVTTVVNKNIEDAYLTSQEKRSLSQAIIVYMDKTFKTFAGAHNLEGATKDVGDYVNMILDGVAAMRNDGGELARQGASHMNCPDRVQSFLEQSGRISGIALGLATSIPGRGPKQNVKPATTKSQAKPTSKPNGRAHEIPSGKIHETSVLDSMQKWLGEGYKSLEGGRYVSKDGLRQARYGQHETRPGRKEHVHFEAYDAPSGKIIENSVVEIVK